MADDRTSDQFIREVDEELRRDQIRALWDRYGVAIVAACVAIVLITAGYRGYVWWQERQAAQSGDRYIAALQAAEAGDLDKAQAELASLARDGSGGYAVLARLRSAALAADAGDAPAAIAAFDAIAADPQVEPAYRDLARVRSGLLALGAGDLDGAAQRVEGLAVGGSPWRHAAREVLGTVAFQKGEMERAREHFSAIQADVEAPQALQERAGVMVALIDCTHAAPPAQPTPAEPTSAQATGATSDTQATE